MREKLRAKHRERQENEVAKRTVVMCARLRRSLPCLFPRMTVQDNVIVGMHTRTKGNIFSGVFFTKKEKEERASCVREADTILRLLGLYEDRFEMGTSLPYGSQRKLEIARALATRPKLLLLDEPAAGMNEQETEELRQIVYRLKEMGYAGPDAHAGRPGKVRLPGRGYAPPFQRAGDGALRAGSDRVCGGGWRQRRDAV